MLRLDEAIRLLMKEDEESHEQGLTEVDRLVNQIRSSADVRQLLELATREYPYDESRFGDSTNVEIVTRISPDAPGYIGAVEQTYDLLKGFTHERILRRLMDLDTEESCRTVLRLLSRPVSKSVGLHTTLGVPLRDLPNHGLCMFPGLLELIPRLDNRVTIYHVISAYVLARKLDIGRFPEFHDYCIGRMIRILDDESRQPINENTAEEARRDYERAYLELERLLVLGRYWNCRASAELLHKALIHDELFADLAGFDGWWEILGRPDPLGLKLVAAASLLARNGSVDSSLLESLAADRILRSRLWQELEEVGRLDAFPTNHKTQLGLAEAEMVQWLEYPTEMTMPPEQIEFVKCFDYPAEEKSQAFLFKFRHPEFLDGDWFVGMAGPYPAAGPPRMGGAKTFSIFQRFDSKSLEEHVADYMPDEED